MAFRKILVCLIFFTLLKPFKCSAELCTRLVNITAYSHGAKCAWGDRPRSGIIAVSRDLERAGLTRGTIVYIEGVSYVVKDRTAEYKKNLVDVYMKRGARIFGKKRLKIFWHKKNRGRRKLHKGRRKLHK